MYHLKNITNYKVSESGQFIYTEDENGKTESTPYSKENEKYILDEIELYYRKLASTKNFNDDKENLAQIIKYGTFLATTTCMGCSIATLNTGMESIFELGVILNTIFCMCGITKDAKYKNILKNVNKYDFYFKNKDIINYEEKNIYNKPDEELININDVVNMSDKELYERYELVTNAYPQSLLLKK